VTKRNPENERVKRQYLSFLKEAGRLSEASIDQVATKIDRFAAYNRQRRGVARVGQQAAVRTA
jgi:hypothetical protein